MRIADERVVTTPDTIIQNIVDRFPQRIDLGLGRIQCLLDVLGNPERLMPAPIHVAGTNGKGSTIAFLRAMLQSGGHTVHQYTSPHLVALNERFLCAGQPVTDAALSRALQQVGDAVTRHDIPITQFEVLTAAACVLFSETSADYSLIEVGLGGRLDATNVITPRLSIITPIGMDHMAFLGDSLSKIAAEKAGIIKPNTPVIIGPQDPDAHAVLVEQINRVVAPMISWGQGFDGYTSMGRLVVQTEHDVLDLPKPSLHGRHQVINATVAAVAARRLGIAASHIADGVKTAVWPGRLQLLTSGKYAECLPGAELWLDGCHNAHGARAAAEFFADCEQRTQRPLHVIVGMLSNRNPGDLLRPFKGLARHIHGVPVPDADCQSPDAIATAAQAYGIAATAHANLDDALNDAHAQKAGRVAIIGSLYLIGDVLRQNRA